MSRQLAAVSARLMATLLLALVVACGAVSQSSNSPKPPSDEAIEALRPVLEAYDLLQEEFVEKDQLTDDELSAGAIRGMLQTLQDPYSTYVIPERQELSLDDSFGGIGAQVAIVTGQITIVVPLPDSPAMQAGIRAGDVVLSVDGESLEGKSLMDAVLLIRGPLGTPVLLEVVHRGEIQPEEITIVRGTIVTVSVSGQMITPDIGYILLSSFKEHTPEQLREVLLRLRDEGARGIVLDLRNNGGGLVSKAVDVASEFLDRGNVLKVEEADGTERKYAVNPGGVAIDIPLVLLVNGFSASSAEMVAGALQDHGRAPLVGTRTFGKGSLSVIAELSNGAGLNVTTSRWFTPNGRVVEGLGLEPDVAVGTNTGMPDTEASRRIQQFVPLLCNAYAHALVELRARPDLSDALSHLCVLPATPPAGTGPDIQLQRAVEVLQRLL
jgi:carboxyl-terminal processing protease